jgi:uncharacterized protein (TIGR02118 family)
VEHVVVAVWRAPAVDAAACERQVREAWAVEALADDNVEACAVSFAVADQPYTGDPCDALVALGLGRAHDLDDVPARDLLHRVARRAHVWRVETHRPLRWERAWADGEDAPGVKMVSFMRRAEGLTHEQFARHWTERHTPLALAHHPGLWNYTQHVVRRALTPGGDDVDGIAELHFRTRDDYDTRFFDSDAGRAAILEDVKRFMAPPGRETALMREVPLLTP